MIDRDDGDLRLSESEMNTIGEAKAEMLEAFSELARLELHYARRKETLLSEAEKAEWRHQGAISTVVKFHGLEPLHYDVDFARGCLVRVLAGVFAEGNDKPVGRLATAFEEGIREDLMSRRSGAVKVTTPQGGMQSPRGDGDEEG